MFAYVKLPMRDSCLFLLACLRRLVRACVRVCVRACVRACVHAYAGVKSEIFCIPEEVIERVEFAIKGARGTTTFQLIFNQMNQQLFGFDFRDLCEKKKQNTILIKNEIFIHEKQAHSHTAAHSRTCTLPGGSRSSMSSLLPRTNTRTLTHTHTHAHEHTCHTSTLTHSRTLTHLHVAGGIAVKHELFANALTRIHTHTHALFSSSLR